MLKESKIQCDFFASLKCEVLWSVSLGKSRSDLLQHEKFTLLGMARVDKKGRNNLPLSDYWKFSR